MKMLRGLMLALILVLVAVCSGAETAGTAATRQTIDLRHQRNFNPWRVWWENDAYRTQYTWTQWRAELAKLNGKADTDYNLRHIGLGSYRKAKGIVLLPQLTLTPTTKATPVALAPSHSPATKNEAVKAVKVTPVNKVAQPSAPAPAKKENAPTPIKVEVAPATASIPATAQLELAKKVAELAEKEQEILTRAEKLRTWEEGLANQKKSLEEKDVSFDLLTKKNQELAIAQATLKGKIQHRGQLVIAEFLLIVFLLVAIGSIVVRKNRRIARRDEKVAGLKKGYNEIQTELDCLHATEEEERSTMEDTMITLDGLREQFASQEEYTEKCEKLIERAYSSWTLMGEQRHSWGGPAEDIELMLLRGRKEGNIFPLCDGVELKLENFHGHLNRCRHCQEILQRLGITSDPNPAEEVNEAKESLAMAGV